MKIKIIVGDLTLNNDDAKIFYYNSYFKIILKFILKD